MRDRVLFDGNLARVITSKPGFDANPTQADENKTFDSNWFYGGGIKFVLEANSLTDTNVNFPYQLDYIPAVFCMTLYEMSKEPMKAMGKDSQAPSVPSDAVGVVLGGGVNVSQSGIHNLALQTNPYYNYVSRFLVFEA